MSYLGSLQKMTTSPAWNPLALVTLRAKHWGHWTNCTKYLAVYIANPVVNHVERGVQGNMYMETTIDALFVHCRSLLLRRQNRLLAWIDRHHLLLFISTYLLLSHGKIKILSCCHSQFCHNWLNWINEKRFWSVVFCQRSVFAAWEVLHRIHWRCMCIIVFHLTRR